MREIAGCDIQKMKNMVQYFYQTKSEDNQDIRRVRRKEYGKKTDYYN